MKINLDISFVILHYLTYEDTKECIESIVCNIDTDKYRIIVVDNNSQNGSYEKLCESFKDNERIVLIHNEENLGFAKGNNVGIDYCRNNFNSDYVAVINNDIILSEKNLTGKLAKKFEEKHFAVLGPKIQTKDGRFDSNPVSLTGNSVKKCKAKILLFRIKYLFSLIGLDNLIFGILLKNILSNMNSGKKKTDNPENSEHVNVKLHGAFLVFSSLYFETFRGFDPCTFLYSEEEILYTHLMANGLISVYTPDILIFHKEDAATEAAHGKSLKRRRFVYRCSIDSLKKCVAIKEQTGSFL